jgi:uncharacterized repeat protein (TIGR04076 family)
VSRFPTCKITILKTLYHKVLFTLMLKGDFGTWMKDPNVFVTCCTDGIKPVIFKIERLTESMRESHY